jgi:hypothetical protein
VTSGDVAGPEALARLLLAHIEHAGILDVALLATDPLAALEADPTIRVQAVESGTLPHDCSVAACYDRLATPARLLIARGASPGRIAFSVLHEYGHHLRDQVDAVVDILWEQRDQGAELEERMCDAFAGLVLAPEAHVREVLNGGVTALAVQRLFVELSASREAAAVAAARQLRAPGYVMLLNERSEATFTARARGSLPVARGTHQDADILVRGANGRARRGVARVRYASGSHGPELLVDVDRRPLLDRPGTRRVLRALRR